MDSMRFEHRHLDVACSLDGGELGTRAREWRRLVDDHGLGTEPIPRGARVWLHEGAFDTAADLARREGDCCGFLDFEVARDGHRVRLDITSEAPLAGQVIEALTGCC